jgi:hypothetical protein
MATLTIRNVDDQVREQIRLQAAEHGRSMEAELRAILEDIARRRQTKPGDVFRRIQKRFSKIGGLEDGELVMPLRDKKMPEPLKFEE